jgi:hypothetical protein
MGKGKKIKPCDGNDHCTTGVRLDLLRRFWRHLTHNQGGFIMIKTTLLAATIATSFALPAFSGGLADPVMETDIVIAETATASSGSAVLPIIVFSMLVALAASN